VRGESFCVSLPQWLHCTPSGIACCGFDFLPVLPVGCHKTQKPATVMEPRQAFATILIKGGITTTINQQHLYYSMDECSVRILILRENIAWCRSDSVQTKSRHSLGNCDGFPLDNKRRINMEKDVIEFSVRRRFLCFLASVITLYTMCSCMLWFWFFLPIIPVGCLKTQKPAAVREPRQASATILFKGGITTSSLTTPVL